MSLCQSSLMRICGLLSPELLELLLRLACKQCRALQCRAKVASARTATCVQSQTTEIKDLPSCLRLLVEPWQL